MKIGLIGHAAIATRPNVAKAYAILLRFLQNPLKAHRDAADHVIAYLYNTRHYGLVFRKKEEPMEIYVDASFADNQEDQKSLQGVLIMMYGSTVNWQAKKQRTVTKSTTEAELLALSLIAGSGYWWKRLFTEIDPIFDDTSTWPNPDTSLT